MKLGDLIILKVKYESGTKAKYLVHIDEFHSNGLSGFFKCLNYRCKVNDQWPRGRWDNVDIVSIEVI